MQPNCEKRQLNLLFVNAGTDIGGTETMLLRFLEKVDRNRFKVWVAAFFNRGPLLSEARKRGFEAVLFAINHQWNPLEILYAFARLYYFLKSRRIDIVHIYGFYTNILGGLVAHLAKTPIAITGVRTEEFGQNGYHNILERLTANWVDLYIAVSEQSRRQMLKKPWVQNEKVVVVHNGIDVGWARPVRNPKNHRQEPVMPDMNSNTSLISNGVKIGMIGAFNRLKAQEILVSAAPLILAKFPKARFIFMGEGKTKMRITNFISQKGLSESFVLLDFAVDPRIILSQLDIFVLATHTEGLPVTILEAMAFGLPVVASRVGGIPEIVKHGVTGTLVQPENPEALASAIIELLENPARARKMGVLGKSVVQTGFGIDNMMANLENYYNELAWKKRLFHPVRSLENHKRETKTPDINRNTLLITNEVKKVLLIAPPVHSQRYVDLIPCGLLSIAGYLRKSGYAAKVYNSSFYKQDSYAEKIEKTIKLIKESMPDFVGIGFPTEALDAAVEIARRAKNSNKGLNVIVGGIHPSAKPLETMSVQYFDYLVHGEGEITTKELLDALIAENDIGNVKGISFGKKGTIINTEARLEMCNLDEIPFDNRDLLIDFEKYPKAALGQIHTSRGCPYQCAYCSASIIWKKKVRFRSVANVMGEIEYLVSQYHVRDINFADDNFALDPGRVAEICEAIIRSEFKIHWRCCARADIHRNFNLALLRLMRRAGCKQICIGFESGAQGLLDKVNRGVAISESAKVLKLMKAARIGLHADFIIGLPGETRATLDQTFQLIGEVWKVCQPTMNIALFKPYPGTDVFEKKGEIEHAQLSHEFKKIFAFAEACNIKKLSRNPRYVGKKIVDNISAPRRLVMLVKKGLTPWV